MSVCVYVTIQNTLFWRSWRLLVKSQIANIGMQRHKSCFFHFVEFCVFQLFWVFGASLLSHSLLWIKEELAGGGSLLPPSLPPTPPHCILPPHIKKNIKLTKKQFDLLIYINPPPQIFFDPTTNKLFGPTQKTVS